MRCVNRILFLILLRTERDLKYYPEPSGTLLTGDRPPLSEHLETGEHVAMW